MNACTEVLKVTLYKIVKRWQSAKRLSHDEWANKMRYVCTMEYYSTAEGTRVLIHAIYYGWCQVEHVRYQMSHLYDMHIGKSIETESRLVASRGREKVLAALWVQNFPLRRQNLLEIDGGDSCITFLKQFLCIGFWARDRNIKLPFHLTMHSLVGSCACPAGDQAHNPGGTRPGHLTF